MHIEEVKNLNHKDKFIFGIAVGYIGKYLHSSLIYKVGEQIKSIDFFGNSIRSNFTLGDLGHHGFVYVKYNTDVIIDPIAEQVPAFCEFLREREQDIDFGIKFTNTKFTEEGSISYAEGDFGLTCSTFILSILNSLAIKLVDVDNWEERDDDIEWQKQIMEIYNEKNNEEDGKYDEMLEYYKKNLGSFRFKPSDIAAATSSDSLPATFIYCNTKGEEILKILS